MSLLQPYQPKGFIAGQQRAQKRRADAADAALDKEAKVTDIAAKRAQLEEFIATKEERAEQRRMDLEKTGLEITDLQEEIAYNPIKRMMEEEKAALETKKKKQDIETSEAREEKLREEADKLKAEGENFKALTAQTKSTTGKHQQGATQGFFNLAQLEKTLGLLEANPDDFGAAANLKQNLYGFATQLNAVLPDNPVSVAAMDALGEGLRVEDLATIKSNIALASSALVKLVSGNDTRFTDFDMRRANEINVAAQSLTSGRQAIPVLRDLIQIVRNNQVTSSILANHEEYADANSARAAGMFDYDASNNIYTAPKVNGVDYPIVHLSDTAEDKAFAMTLPAGARFTVTMQDGSRRHLTVGK